LEFAARLSALSLPVMVRIEVMGGVNVNQGIPPPPFLKFVHPENDFTPTSVESGDNFVQTCTHVLTKLPYSDKT